MTDDATATNPRLDDPALTLARIMQVWPETIPVFIHHRMHCIGCPVSRFVTISDACRTYGLARDVLLADLADAITPPTEPR